MFEQEFTFLRVFWRLRVRYPESSWIICVSLSNAWLIWIINMLAKCLNFPETWQMCFLGHEMISDSIAASSLKCFAPDGHLLKPKIQVAPKILARRAKEGLQVKLIRCYGWWINIKWNVSITNLQISQSQSVEFWIQWNSTQSNDFYCQQWFSNVRFRVPPEFGSPSWDDSLVDVSLIGPTFPTSNFGSQNLLLPRVTLNFGIALVVWWKIDYFWWVFPVTSSTFFSTPNSFGRGHPLAMLRAQDLGVQGSQTTTFSFFHQGGRRRYETDGRSCPSADEMKWKLIDVSMWEGAEKLIN